MTDFSLDRTENPHPAMRAHALEYRRRATIVRQHWAPTDTDIAAAQLGVLITWGAYLQAMMDATGATAAELNAWLDRAEHTPHPRPVTDHQGP